MLHRNIVRLKRSMPGHSGILGKELADELARNVSDSKFIGTEPALGIYAGSHKIQKTNLRQVSEPMGKIN